MPRRHRGAVSWPGRIASDARRLRLIAGILTPTSGRIETSGAVGYLPQTLTLGRDTTIAQLLGIAGKLAACAQSRRRGR